MNIIISGPPASGKTFIALAMANLFPKGSTPTRYSSISAAKYLLQKKNDQPLLIVDECRGMNEILELQQIHNEKKSEASIIYCTQEKIEAVEGITLIDLWRDRSNINY